MNLCILYEDPQIIVCIKPAGVPTQTARLGMPDMVSLLKNYLKEPYLAVIHRLDQPVEGILVFAKTPQAARELSRQMQKKEGLGKYYKAVVCGTLEEPSGVMVDYLIKDGRTNLSRVAGPWERDAKKAVLSYEVLETFEKEGKRRSLLHIKLDTGRHHQIRVQMAERGCPILGDVKYGGDRWGQIALFAYRLEFVHPKSRQKLTFEMELPNVYYDYRQE